MVRKAISKRIKDAWKKSNPLKDKLAGRPHVPRRLTDTPSDLPSRKVLEDFPKAPKGSATERLKRTVSSGKIIRVKPTKAELEQAERKGFMRRKPPSGWG